VNHVYRPFSGPSPARAGDAMVGALAGHFDIDMRHDDD